MFYLPIISSTLNQEKITANPKKKDFFAVPWMQAQTPTLAPLRRTHQRKLRHKSVPSEFHWRLRAISATLCSLFQLENHYSKKTIIPRRPEKAMVAAPNVPNTTRPTERLTRTTVLCFLLLRCGVFFLLRVCSARLRHPRPPRSALARYLFTRKKWDTHSLLARSLNSAARLFLGKYPPVTQLKLFFNDRLCSDKAKRHFKKSFQLRIEILFCIATFLY